MGDSRCGRSPLLGGGPGLSLGILAPGTLDPDTLALHTLALYTLALGSLVLGSLDHNALDPDTRALGTLDRHTLAPHTFVLHTPALGTLVSGTLALVVVVAVVVLGMVFQDPMSFGLQACYVPFLSRHRVVSTDTQDH